MSVEIEWGETRRDRKETGTTNAFFVCSKLDYMKNNMSTDREKGRGNKRARVTRASLLHFCSYKAQTN
jgi:hypothetical protein